MCIYKQQHGRWKNERLFESDAHAVKPGCYFKEASKQAALFNNWIEATASQVVNVPSQKCDAGQNMQNALDFIALNFRDNQCILWKSVQDS